VSACALGIAVQVALTPHTVELIPTLRALSPRGGPVQDPTRGALFPRGGPVQDLVFTWVAVQVDRATPLMGLF